MLMIGVLAALRSPAQCRVFLLEQFPKLTIYCNKPGTAGL